MARYAIHHKKCPQCDKEFLAFYSTRKFCGKKCFNENSKISRLGEKNPAYRNGFYSMGKRIYYPKDRRFDALAKKIKEDLMTTQGYLSCSICFTNQTLSWECHHIIFRSEAPKHQNIHNPRNIILLCCACHNNLHKHKQLRNPLVKERRLWELFPEYLQPII